MTDEPGSAASQAQGTRSASNHADLKRRQSELAAQLKRLDVDESRALDCSARGFAAAVYLREMKAPEEAITAALLAPCTVLAEFPPTSLDPAPDNEVLAILDGVARLSQVRWDQIDESTAETLRKLFLAMAQDIRVVLVALSLRLAAMSSLNDPQLDAAERIRLAKETVDVFAPLANRLGIWHLKSKLEDAALSILEPESYRTILDLLKEKQGRREQFIQQVIGLLSERLDREGMDCTITGRPKHVFSIYNKMHRKQVRFDELRDISAVRVVTERLSDCYSVLGVVHDLWRPIPGEFDDYIAMPKSNGYQSLHTAVVGPQGRVVEVQIRTQEMHRFAELGVAAHWAYKEHRRASTAENERLLLLRRVLDWERELSDPKQFVDSLRTILFEDEVFVFTPDGDVIDLPKGATPIDFAYRVHTMVGHRCRGARVNGQIVSLDTELRTGDRVEILTQKLPKPNRDWMNAALGYCVTTSARAKVRHWFKQQAKDDALSEGKELIHKELQRVDLKGVSLERVAAKLGFGDVDELFLQVGRGSKRAQTVAAAALDLDASKRARTTEAELPTAARKKPPSADGLTVDGIPNVMAKPGACCRPVPGDDVVGFVTRGRGVVIHRRDCRELQATMEPQRIIDVDWNTGREERHSVPIELRTSDQPHLLAQFSSKLASFGVGVSSAKRLPQPDGSVILQFTLECHDAEQLTHVLSRLARDSGVSDVRRSSS